MIIPDRDEEGNILSATVGRFERSDIVLKLAKHSGQADSNGDLALDIVIPGEAGAITRYAAGGYAYVDNYAWDDAITKVEVIDVDDIFGYGANTVLKEYHDSEVDESNRGWYFEKSYGSEGNVDIEPMGWYGELRGGLTLRITFKVSANAKIKIIIWWGKKE